MEGPLEGFAGGKGWANRSPYLRWAWRGLWWPHFTVRAVDDVTTTDDRLWLAAAVWPANKLMKETQYHSARSSISIDQ